MHYFCLIIAHNSLGQKKLWQLLSRATRPLFKNPHNKMKPGDAAIINLDHLCADDQKDTKLTVLGAKLPDLFQMANDLMG